MPVSASVPRVAAVLAGAVQRLAAVGSARLDAELLLADLLGIAPGLLFSRHDTVLDEALCAAYAARVERRRAGEPVAYILGQWEFWSLPLQVTPGVLIPRPETELLVEWGLQLLGTAAAPAIADLGTGSGAIAIAYAHERPQASVTAVDVSAQALALAQRNAQALGLALQMRQADFTDALHAMRGYDLIVSNPPYVRDGDPHLEALTHEPRLALVSGTDGLDSLRSITAHALPALKHGGWLLLEHGFDQGAAVRALLTQAGFAAVETRRDLEGRERASGGRRP